MNLVEKYRPKTLDEIVGQEHVVRVLKELAKREDIPHLLFVGKPGVGKTTAAYCFARELFGEEWKDRFYELNASDERGIDVVRNKIKKLARINKKKIIFLDECDALTEDAQQALRRIMETHKRTIFILSCNYENKLIDPIKSRCLRLLFKPLKKEDIAKRLVEIIEMEGIKISDMEKTREALLKIIEISKGDMRKCINLLEQLINSKKELTPENVLMVCEPSKLSLCLRIALDGDFEKAKELLTEYLKEYDVETIIDEFLSAISEIPDEQIRIRLYEKLAELEYRMKLSCDPYIQILGFLAFVWVIRYVPKCPIMRKR